MSATTLQQLAQPERITGKTPAQVLRDLFLEISSPSASSKTQSCSPDAKAPPTKNASSVRKPPAQTLQEEKKGEAKSFAEYMKDLGGSEDEYSDDFHDSEEDAPKKSKPVAAAKRGTSVTAFGKSDLADDVSKSRQTESRTSVTAFGKKDLADDVSKSLEIRQPLDSVSTRERTSVSKVSSNKSAVRCSEKSNSDVDAEVMRLRAQVNELKSQLASSKRPSENVNLANTLPSRLHMLEDNDGMDKLKQQLQDEQKRAKRLERDNQKLQDRARESSQSGSSSSAPHVDMSEIKEGEILSKSGGFSIIYKGTWHGTPVAIKKLFDPSNSPENLAELDNEVSKLGKLRHPNILSLLAVHRKPPAYSIILEIVNGGSLFQLLHSRFNFNFAPGTDSTVPVEKLLDIDASVGLALTFMHARNVVHRDIKSHNVLLSPHLETKLCDFGLARMKSELMTGVMQFAGTPQYMAPELLRQQKYTEKVDTWAYGVLLWETMAADIPFANLDVPEIRELATSGKMLAMPPDSPRPIQAVIKSCWAVDQSIRPAMSHVLEQVHNSMC
jgi:tRNA A-37 threonylcarbamoyl transferase component Bud32